MLHTIWLITKIILLILAALAGFLLVLILGLLFMPFRYRVKVDTGNGMRVTATVSWMFFFLRIKAVYVNKKTDWCVRIFGIPAASSVRKKPEKKTARKKESSRKKKKEDDTQKNCINNSNNSNNIKNIYNSENTDNLGDADSYSRKRKLWETVRGIPDRIKKIWYGIKKLWYTVGEWRKLLKSERFKAAFRLCKDDAFYIIKKIRPRRIKGFIEFGTGDPASTGQCLGLIAVIYGYIGKKLRIIPDFENKVCNADVVIGGRIPAGKILLKIWHIYRNKNLRMVLRKMEHIGGNEYERE